MTAVLASGGLDSCILLADLSTKSTVFPLYVRAGLVWEDEEYTALQAFITRLQNERVMPVTTLFLPLEPLYGSHWSITGAGIPTGHDPGTNTFLPGRNILLLTLAAVWCSKNNVHKIAIGTLKSNPFADASVKFFKSFAKALSQGLDFHIEIDAPYRQIEKKALIQKFAHLPLEMTNTCMAPHKGKQCGKCSKCVERKVAFTDAQITDRTVYI